MEVRWDLLDPRNRFKLRYQGKRAPLLRALHGCAKRGLDPAIPEDLATIQEELDRVMARQEGGESA